jgi:hypothetical protein
MERMRTATIASGERNPVRKPEFAHRAQGPASSASKPWGLAEWSSTRAVLSRERQRAVRPQDLLKAARERQTSLEQEQHR